MEGVLVMVFVSYFAIKAMLLIIDCKYKVKPTDQLQQHVPYKVLSVLYQYENLTEDLDESGEKKKSPGGEKKVLNC